ncbi:MAG: hypothetical protein OIF51_04235 [Cellvibrionaceae bacterium]|nr:hypothetical protein [Cellvibrionaceae bacterium]
MPVLFVVLLPAFTIMGGSIDAGFKEDKGESTFVAAWLLFAIATFMYFVIAQPLLSFSVQKIANKFSKQDRLDGGPF